MVFAQMISKSCFENCPIKEKNMKSCFVKIVLYTTLVLAFQAAPGLAEWKIFGDMPIPVAGGEAVTLNGKIYILGGVSDSIGIPIQAIQEFDPKADIGEQWRIAGRMLTPRANFVAKAYNGVILIAGGETGPEQVNVNAMEMWSPVKGSLLVDEGARLNRIGATGEVWNNLFIIIGGFYRSSVDAAANAIAAFDVFERREGFSLSLPKTLIPYNHASFMFEDTIYIAGGVRTGVSKRIYAISIKGLLPGRVQPEMLMLRASFEAVLAAPKAVWFIGGYNEDNRALAAASVFSKTEFGYQIKPAPKLHQGRRELMAAKLGDAIYVFGGRNSHNEIVPVVEKMELRANTAVEEKLVHSFMLRQNYPNPFNPATTITFEVPYAQQARLEVFAANGSLIKTLLDAPVGTGVHSLQWNGTAADGVAAASGVYFYKLTTELNVEIRKMVLVK